MQGYQCCIMAGNVCKDPELKYTQQGTAVCNFSLAINRKKSGGEDEVLFMNCQAWNKTAEVVAEHVKKGNPLLVEGYLRERKWTTPEGQERKAIELTANRVQFLGGQKREDAPAPGESDVPF